jgi:ADP-ribose pyrophosphatase YjhB (NUDIX family)
MILIKREIKLCNQLGVMLIMTPIDSFGKPSPQQAADMIRLIKEAGKARNIGEQTEDEFLADYNKNLRESYEKPSVTVDMLIFTVVDKKTVKKQALPDKELRLLLVKRGGHPFKGDWALPGGFVNMNESIDDAAKRELKEETNLDGIYMEQLFTWGEVNRDPRMRVISVSYMALIDSTKVNVHAGNDAEDCKWFTVTQEEIEDVVENSGEDFIHTRKFLLILRSGEDEILSHLKKESNSALSKTSVEILDSVNIAFDHAKIISYGLERLRNKLEYTPIAFNLVPRLFTITGLQKIYEAILGRALLSPNFRRKIAPLVCETDLVEKGVHRPAKLYEYNPAWVLKSFE